MNDNSLSSNLTLTGCRKYNIITPAVSLLTDGAFPSTSNKKGRSVQGGNLIGCGLQANWADGADWADWAKLSRLITEGH